MHNCNEGVYNLKTTEGVYIGQTSNYVTRIKYHKTPKSKIGKMGAVIEEVTKFEMPGSTKLEREVYEQYLIKKSGIKNLINTRNPMGGRKELFNRMIDNVIEKFNLPR